MPHNKIGRVRLLKSGGEDQIFTAEGGEMTDDDHPLLAPHMFRCCTPRSCRQPDVQINGSHPGYAVKVICNNDECTKAKWMHKDCFEGWS